MKRFANDRLPTSPNQIKDVFLYWLSTNTRELSRKLNEPSVPIQMAEKILQKVIDTNDPKIIEPVLLEDGDNVWMGSLSRLQMTYLGVIQSTRVQLRLKGYRDRINPLSRKEAILALENASRIQELANRLHADPTYPRLRKSLLSYETLLNLWSRRCKVMVDCGPPDKPMMAFGYKMSTEECLEEMKRLLLEMKHSQDMPNPTPVFYSILFATMSQCRQVNQARNMLHELEKEMQFGPVVYGSVLMGYSVEARNPEVKDDALSLWEHVEKLPHVSWDLLGYSAILNILNKAGDPFEVQRILDEMETKSSDNPDIAPTRVHYNIALHAWSHSDSTGERVKGLIERMIRLDGQGRQNIYPDRISFTSGIYSLLCNKTNPKGVDQAFHLLEQSENSTEKANRPDYTLYRTFLTGLSIRRGYEKEVHVKEHLCRLMEQFLEHWRRQRDVEPPKASDYEIVLYSWSNSFTPLAGQHGLNVLMEMDEHNVRPTIDTYELVMKCLGSKSSDERSIVQAQELLKRIKTRGLEITNNMFSYYIRILCRSFNIELVRHAEELVAEAERNYKEGRSVIKPSEGTYRVLIFGYSKFPEGARDAERILETMKTLSAEDYRTDIRPTLVTYSACIDTWSKSQSSQAYNRIESLFQELCERATPNTYFYATYQSAINRLDIPDKAHRIEAILNRMQTEFEDGTNAYARPDDRNFSLVIQAWASNGDRQSAERAMAILDRMEALSHHTKYSHLQPTVGCYRGAIRAFALVGDHDSGMQALQILDRMHDKHLEPDRKCYGYAIMALGRSKDPERAQKALTLLKRMQSSFDEHGHRHAKPTPKEYLAILQACYYCDEAPNESLQIAIEAVRHYLQHQKPLKTNELNSLVDMFGKTLQKFKGGESARSIISRCFEGVEPSILEEEPLKSTFNAVIHQL